MTNAAGNSSTTHAIVVNSVAAKVTRDAGPSRYGTAAAIATTEFTGPVPVAYIATGQNYPDALAGGAAAGHHHGPVLLIDSKNNLIPVETQDALSKLKPARIVVLGGTGVVSSNIFNQLKNFVDNAANVTRESGGDRYATAGAIAKAEFTSPVPVAFIATGTNFPDALTGAAAAGRHGGPVLLVNPASTSIPSATASALTALHPARIVVLGGSAVVSNTLKTKLQAYTSGSVTRESGSDRYATAAAVATHEFSSPVNVAYIATAQNFPDALAGAAAAGTQGGPVLLIDSVHNTIPTVIKNALTTLHPKKIVILGGTSVVSSSIQSQLASFVP